MWGQQTTVILFDSNSEVKVSPYVLSQAFDIHEFWSFQGEPSWNWLLARQWYLSSVLAELLCLRQKPWSWKQNEVHTDNATAAETEKKQDEPKPH